VIVLGLTGSIGMGKSHAAKTLRDLGARVHDSDRVVHGLLAAGGGGVAPVAALFPDCVSGGSVDRRLLGARVFGDPQALAALEAILHPLVTADRNRTMRQWQRQGVRLGVLDIPLLFETGAQRHCDLTVLVTAPAFVQRARVLGRAGMTESRLRSILARQMPDSEKRRQADVIVQTGLSKAFTRQQLHGLVQWTRGAAGLVWPPRYRRHERRARRGEG